MSFQRITTIGSIPPANSDATAVALEPVALVLEAVDLHEVWAELGARAKAAQRLRDLLAGTHEHFGELDGLLHRRLDAVQAELRGHLLGVVDDVIERCREGVAVARVEGRAHAAAPGEPVDDVVRDAIAFLLADLQVLRQRVALGVLLEQIVQQQPAALHVAAGLLHEPHEGAVDGPREEAHQPRIFPAGLRRPSHPHLFTFYSHIGHHFATPRGAGCASVRDRGGVSAEHEDRSAGIGGAADGSSEVIYAGELEIRPREGLVLASGAVVTLSVREFEVLVAMARRLGAIITREQLYGSVWGGELRAGDRSVDVYVSKLRSKLEAALPDRRFIHTHPGFGYRFQPQSSQNVHIDAPRP